MNRWWILFVIETVTVCFAQTLCWHCGIGHVVETRKLTKIPSMSWSDNCILYTQQMPCSSFHGFSSLSTPQVFEALLLQLAGPSAETAAHIVAYFLHPDADSGVKTIGLFCKDFPELFKALQTPAVAQAAATAIVAAGHLSKTAAASGCGSSSSGADSSYSRQHAEHQQDQRWQGHQWGKRQYGWQRCWKQPVHQDSYRVSGHVHIGLVASYPTTVCSTGRSPSLEGVLKVLPPWHATLSSCCGQSAKRP